MEENKKAAKQESPLKKFIDGGMPVKEALFHSAVNSIHKSPEERFTDGSIHKSRDVKMWWTQIGLVCFQRDEYFLVPEATVKVAYFK